MPRLGLNHAVRETRVEAFHTIVIKVPDHCGQAIPTNAGVAALPRAPHALRRLAPFAAHRECLPSGLTLADYLDLCPVLRQLADAGRPFWYNLGTAPRRLRRPEAPIIPAEGLSACTGVALLAGSGVRAMRTLGMDAGRTHFECFQDLYPTGAAAPSFDSQFATLARLIGSGRLDLGPPGSTDAGARPHPGGTGGARAGPGAGQDPAQTSSLTLVPTDA